jgi:hypothetical protein
VLDNSLLESLRCQKEEAELKLETLSKIFEEAQDSLLKENKMLRNALVSSGHSIDLYEP